MFSLRVSPPGIEWKSSKRAEIRKWEEIGRKIENGPRPEMGEQWPKNGEKMGFGVIFLFFAIFGPFFPHFGPRAILHFSANFFPFSDFAVFHSIPGRLARNENAIEQKNSQAHVQGRKRHININNFVR